MAYRRLFTSESVTEGHPDKLADQISDAVLDAILANDPEGRVACETFAITGQIHIAGEITTKTYVDIPRIVRETIKEVGYDKLPDDYMTLLEASAKLKEKGHPCGLPLSNCNDGCCILCRTSLTCIWARL